MWTTAIARYLLVASLLATGAMFRAPALSQRLAALRRSLLLLGPGVLALGLVTAITPRVPVHAPASGALDDASWSSVRGEIAAAKVALAALGITFVLLFVQGAAVLAELRAFVTKHELDLAARDEAALLDAGERNAG
jgi:hypothetical protein